MALIQREVPLDDLQEKLQMRVDLASGHGEVSPAQALAFFEFFIFQFQHSKTSASVAYAQQLNLSVFGPVGFAMMAAPTLGQTLATLVRYKMSVATELLANITAEMQHGRMVLEWSVGDYPQAVRNFIIEISLCFVDLVRRQLPDRTWCTTIDRIHISHRPKADFVTLMQQSVPGVPVEYDQAATRLWCDPQAMNLELIASNPETFELLTEQLEQLDQLNLMRGDNVAGALAKLLRQSVASGTFLTSQQAAEKLHMSCRTLTRKLDREATSFQILTDYVRAGLARKLLRTGSLPIKAVAHRCGYASEAGFSRAFKKWYQVTPMEFQADKDLKLPNLPLTKRGAAGEKVS